jgi:hypothetical protein
MTYISSAFSNSTALRILTNSNTLVRIQGAVDEIIEIAKSSSKGTLEVQAAFDGAQIDTTDDDDSNDSSFTVRAYDNATIRTGGGADDIGAYYHAVIDSGSGDDRIETYGDGVVRSGAGKDWIYGYSNMTVDAGDGDDEIRTSGHSTIDGGDGNDLVVTLGYSVVDGGAGNDTLIAVDKSGDKGSSQAGHATLRGGEGDDDIQIGRDSIASGGTGSDEITLVGTGSTVEFAAGDGQDEIYSEDDFTLSLEGYGDQDVSSTVENGNVVLTFSGSDDKITINLREGKTATITFPDGNVRAVTGANDSLGKMTVKSASPEGGRNGVAYRETGYSAVMTAYMADRTA